MPTYSYQLIVNCIVITSFSLIAAFFQQVSSQWISISTHWRLLLVLLGRIYEFWIVYKMKWREKNNKKILVFRKLFTLPLVTRNEALQRKKNRAPWSLNNSFSLSIIMSNWFQWKNKIIFRDIRFLHFIICLSMRVAKW